VNEVQEAGPRNTLPGNMSTSFEGTAKAFQSSLKNLSLLLTIATPRGVYCVGRFV